VFGFHISGGGYHCPDLSLGGVEQHLGVFIFMRVRLNPSFVLEHSSSIVAFGRLTMYLREHFVCNSYYCLEAI
jgi:hypothetical protein